MIEVSRRANCELMPAMTSGSDPTLEGLPLTERVLARLGRPRAVWTMLWAIVPLLSPVLFVPALRASGYVIGEGEVPNLLLTQLALVYADLVILVDIDKLGRQPLTLDLFPQDRTLGLQDVGAAASAGLGLVLVAAAPVLLAGGDEPVTLVVGLAIVAI